MFFRLVECDKLSLFCLSFGKISNLIGNGEIMLSFFRPFFNESWFLKHENGDFLFHFIK